ncbi:MAG TPA: hypothetical protein VFS37_15555 [Conexibacter sp.]|nr:hypothetical protein [Conexibacter sp.]
MRPFRRRSRLQRLLARAKDVDLPRRPSDRTMRTGLIAAGGLTGLTAGSAGISSLRRRRNDRERDDS